VSIYEDGEYAKHQKTWHVEESEWKANYILKLFRQNSINPKSVGEVGCGAGEILLTLHKNMPDDTHFVGYDIAPQLEAMWETRSRDRLRFLREDFLAGTENFDVALYIDIVEHIEDYIGFLRKIKERSEYKVIKIPLEVSAVKAMLGHKYSDSRKEYGHLHFFNKDIMLDTLHDLDYEVVDWFYAPFGMEMAGTCEKMPMMSRLLNPARWLLSKVSIDLTSKTLGGYTLFVLAK
jgi:methyltransferase family protein